MSDDVRDAGYDDALDAIAAGRPYALECSNGHRSLPPRRVCPDCGDDDLSEVDLSLTGEIVTYNETHVPTPDFSDDVPYVLAIAEFDDVRFTGMVDADVENVEIGDSVEISIGESETTGRRLIEFSLA
ncbi:MAG: Zn-ribbon domain-containing OB-fold protein [Halococcoides sp.]